MFQLDCDLLPLLGAEIHARWPHRPTGETNQFHCRLEHPGIIKTRAQPFQRCQLLLQFDHPQPTLILCCGKELELKLGNKIDETGGKSLDPGLKAKMQDLIWKLPSGN